MGQGSIEIIITAVLAISVTFPLVKGADFFLKRKYISMSESWNDMLDRCKSDNDSATCASWLSRQKTAASSGKLTYDRVCALAEAGFISAAPSVDRCPTSEREKICFTFTPTIIARLTYTATALVLPILLIAFDVEIPLFLVGCLLSVLLTFIVICDMQARIIPYQTCIAFAVIAIGWILLARPSSIPQSIVLAIASYLVITMVERIAIQFTSASAIGAGDRRLIPLICFLVGSQGLMVGLIGLCLVAGTMAIVALVKGKSKRSYLPFAPALMAFAIAGVAYPLSPFAGALI